MNPTELLDALRKADSVNALDALDASIDAQASSVAARQALHTAARIERARLERNLAPVRVDN